MIKKTYIFIFSAFILCSGYFHSICEGNQQQAKKGLDIVLAIDSSGSMKKTDPLSLRIPAAKLFISLLDQNDKAGIVSFNDKGYPLISLTPVNSVTNKEELLKSAEKISSDGRYTNLYEAVNESYRILSTARDSKESTGIIVLMSDGKMDVGNPDSDNKLIRSLENELAPTLSNKKIKLYTIAFTDFSDKRLLKQIAEFTGGTFNIAHNDKDLHLIFTSIFETLKTPNMLPMQGNSFIIDKSIDEVTVVASKENADSYIYLQSPDEQKFSATQKPDNINWYVTHNFDMITITKPMEGRWQVLSSTEKDNKAYIVTNLNLMTNFNWKDIPVDTPVNLEVWLQRGEEILKRSRLVQRALFYIELTKPGEEKIKMVLFDSGEEPDREKSDGIFTNHFVPDIEGEYILKLAINGMTFQREKTIKFRAIIPTVEEPEEPEEDEEMEAETEEVSDSEQFSWTEVLIHFAIGNAILLCVVILFIFLFKKFGKFKKIVLSILAR